MGSCNIKQHSTGKEIAEKYEREVRMTEWFKNLKRVEYCRELAGKEYVMLLM